MGYAFSHHGPPKGITLALPVICLANQASVKNTEFTHLPRAQAVSPRRARGPNGVPGEIFKRFSLRSSRSMPEGYSALRGEGVGQAHNQPLSD